MTIVNAIVQGIFLGAFYAVLACGLSIMFGVMRIINLAHGDIAVLGAYVVFVIVQSTGMSPFAAFIAALPVMIVLGYVLQLTILERSLKSGILTPLLATFGLSIVIQNLLLIRFSPDVRSLGGEAGAITTSSWQVTSGLSVSALGIVILVVAVVVFGALQLFLSRTRIGWMMRATAEDADAAELAGIDSGGMGSLWGTLLGGLALGVAQTVGAQANPEYSALAGHLLFLAVLVVRYGGGRVSLRLAR